MTEEPKFISIYTEGFREAAERAGVTWRGLTRANPDLYYQFERVKLSWQSRVEEAKASVAWPNSRYRIRADVEERLYYVEKLKVKTPQSPPTRFYGESQEDADNNAINTIAAYRQEVPPLTFYWDTCDYPNGEYAAFTLYESAVEYLQNITRPFSEESFYFDLNGKPLPFGDAITESEDDTTTY